MNAEPSFHRREALAACVGRAALLAAFGGVALGAVECITVLARDEVRSLRAASTLAVLGGGCDAAVTAAVAVVCALVALTVYGRPQHRAAPPSVCAGLGAISGFASFLWSSAVSTGLLLPAALGATLGWLALREQLARWPRIGRASTWGAIAGVAAAACAVMAAMEAPARAEKQASPGVPNVLLISIDTLRADHLGCYGSSSARTPVIDALAREGVLFEDATSQANTTGPSHTTMLTGLYPVEHGAIAIGTPISNRVATLGDALARTHATAAFVSGFTLVDELCGLAERFEVYDDELLAWRWMPRACARLQLVAAAIRMAERRGHDVRRADRPAEETVARAVAWLAARDEPFFCFLHLFDPHAPYEPPERFARLHGAEPEPDWYALPTESREALIQDPHAVQQMKALYAAEISYADEQLGRVLDALRASGELDQTLVVLTSDHGEGLGAHGYWFDHGAHLFDEELHVPLLMRFPRAEHAGVRIEPQVRLLDLAPTVLEVLGRSDALETTGASLVPLIASGAESIERPSYAQAETGGEMSGFAVARRRHSLRVRGHKVIWSSAHWLDTTRVEARDELYDLAGDPGEQHDLAPDPARAAPFAGLRRELERWCSTTADAAERSHLDDAALEQLRRLGYL